MINEIALYEAIEFLNSLKDDRLFFIDDIEENFDFKYQFIRKSVITRCIYQINI